MLLPKNILIEKACSGDASRPVINHVYLQTLENQVHQARLIATNGRIAAIVPVVKHEDTEGYISSEALKASRKGNGSFVCNGVCEMPDGQKFSRPELGKYPNIDQVIPKDAATCSFSIDPELLYNLAQAIGSSRGVTIEYIGENKALRIKPTENPRAENSKGRMIHFTPECKDATGLIMPISTAK